MALVVVRLGLNACRQPANAQRKADIGAGVRLKDESIIGKSSLRRSTEIVPIPIFRAVGEAHSIRLL
jgi:hypothetical protein